jgi:phosphoribosylamine---glycine ligase
MTIKVLVVGGGGREHAITKALSQNTGTDVYSLMARRNPGIARIAKKCHIGSETDSKAASEFAVSNGIDYAVIGPEAPLEAGVVDALDEKGIGCVGPHRASARLETDKGFCRMLMDRHGIAGCPLYRVFYRVEDAVEFVNGHLGDLAVKPIGLTGGKGVKIMGEQVDRPGAIAYIRELGGKVILEERLIGEEFTLQAFVDGEHLVPMPLVQDHKRAFEGDQGPNTGGMGSYSMPDHRLPFVTQTDYEKAISIMKAAVSAMKRMGQPYRGILYGQFMNTARGPMVVEFNARFGDPEAMNVLSLLSSDMTDIVVSIVEGSLSSKKVSFQNKATVCKYLVPVGYPEKPVSGSPISIGEYGNALLYYANVDERDSSLFTQTSRTLAFVGIGDSLADAEKAAETAVSGVQGAVRYRRDIGTFALLEQRVKHMQEVR